MDNKGYLTAKKMDEYFTPPSVVEKIVPFIIHQPENP